MKMIDAWCVEWKGRQMNARAFWYFKTLHDALEAARTLDRQLIGIRKARVPSLMDLSNTYPTTIQESQHASR